MRKSRNPSWVEEEDVLALELYHKLDFGHNSGKFHPSAPQIVELSTLLLKSFHFIPPSNVQ